MHHIYCLSNLITDFDRKLCRSEMANFNPQDGHMIRQGFA